jgi:antitoxin (DNA-binding transcriptional repressor) of toxin-antitoxin stability system
VPACSARKRVCSGGTNNRPEFRSLSVTGVVTDLKPDTRQVIVKTAAGSEVTVTLSDRTTFMRIPPGEKTKDKFIPITPADFGVGDSVFARGRMSEDRKSMPALEFYVMSKADIAQKRERDRDEWTKRGIAGTVSSLNAANNEISIESRTPEGPKPVIIAANAQTQFRRYAPDSVRFSDAKPSTFAELKVGDQLRALGTKSADGSRFTAEEIVAGSFQTIGGTIAEVNVEKQEIKINDLQSKQAVTVVV